MGSAARGMLVFGVDIGDDESSEGFGTLGPKPGGAEEYDAPDVDWYDGEAEDGDGELLSFRSQLILTLAARSGRVVARDEDGELDIDAMEEHVAKVFGVRTVQWGHCDYPRWILAPVGNGFVLSTGGWGLRAVDPDELAGRAVADGIADGAALVMEALRLLGLTTDRAPGWLLVADYD